MQSDRERHTTGHIATVHALANTKQRLPTSEQSRRESAMALSLVQGPRPKFGSNVEYWLKVESRITVRSALGHKQCSGIGSGRLGIPPRGNASQAGTLLALIFSALNNTSQKPKDVKHNLRVSSAWRGRKCRPKAGSSSAALACGRRQQLGGRMVFAVANCKGTSKHHHD
jgi:hypothetical protein